MEKTTKKPRNNFGLMQREMLKYLKGNDLTVYLALLTYSDKYAQCFPSVQTLADDTGLTPRNVQKHLANLDNDGWIDRNYRTNTSTIYQLYFIDTSKTPKKKPQRVSKSDGASKSDASPPSKSDRSGMSKSDVSPLSKSDALTDQLTDHNNKPNNSVVPVSVVNAAAGSKTEKRKLTPSERLDFKNLWNIYGQEGESKRSAESVYSKYVGMGDPIILTRFNNFLDESCGTYMTNQMNQIYEEYQAEKERKLQESKTSKKSL
jgi:predicted transcriptional regulator